MGTEWAESQIACGESTELCMMLRNRGIGIAKNAEVFKRVSTALTVSLEIFGALVYSILFFFNFCCREAARGAALGCHSK